MKIEAILYVVLLVLGIVVAIAPWTITPVCMMEMRCWDTRNLETILGAVIAVVSLVGVFKSLE